MGHAQDGDVQQGRARLVDQHGNAEADAAADLGRCRLLLARSHWYPVLSDLHGFMIAVVRASVNNPDRPKNCCLG